MAKMQHESNSEHQYWIDEGYWILRAKELHPYYRFAGNYSSIKAKK